MTDIKAIGDGCFASHSAVTTALLFCFLFCSNCHTGDRMFHRSNRIDRTGECELYRTTYLSGIFTSRHYSTKCTYVIVFLTHDISCCFRFVLGTFDTFFFMCSIYQRIQYCLLFNEYVISLSAVFCHLNIVADFAF